jgi:hypothetical protein
MGALEARRAGCRPRADGVPRPCTPDDVVIHLDRLFRRHAIMHQDAKVLAKYGRAGRRPEERAVAEFTDAMIWRDALARLEAPLIAAGIVLPRQHEQETQDDDRGAGALAPQPGGPPAGARAAHAADACAG